MKNLLKKRCIFCWMDTELQWLRLPLCSICRDQVYDFAWVSAVQVALFLFGGIDGLFFVIEEILLFAVLVLIKHRVKPPWETHD